MCAQIGPKGTPDRAVARSRHGEHRITEFRDRGRRLQGHVAPRIAPGRGTQLGSAAELSPPESPTAIAVRPGLGAASAALSTRLLACLEVYECHIFRCSRALSILQLARLRSLQCSEAIHNSLRQRDITERSRQDAPSRL